MTLVDVLLLHDADVIPERNRSGQDNRIARIEHSVKEPSPGVLAEVLDDVTAEPDVEALS